MANTMESVKMFLDEKNQTASISFDLSAYDAYIQRGAMLAKEELKEWEWKEGEGE